MIINYISEADTLKKTILFDRDGTINVDFGYTASPTKPILTSMFQQLISNNFPWQRFNLGIVSNQSGIARAKYSYDDMFTFNSELIALLAVPILIQVFFNSFLAYWLNRRLGEKHSVACPSALIGASNFFELAVAAAISLFGFHSVSKQTFTR